MFHLMHKVGSFIFCRGSRKLCQIRRQKKSKRSLVRFQAHEFLNIKKCICSRIIPFDCNAFLCTNGKVQLSSIAILLVNGVIHSLY